MHGLRFCSSRLQQIYNLTQYNFVIKSLIQISWIKVNAHFGRPGGESFSEPLLASADCLHPLPLFKTIAGGTIFLAPHPLSSFSISFYILWTFKATLGYSDNSW